MVRQGRHQRRGDPDASNTNETNGWVVGVGIWRSGRKIEIGGISRERKDKSKAEKAEDFENERLKSKKRGEDDTVLRGGRERKIKREISQ